ncbi:MAG TPA: aromatic-ring-hydroxylating dioxygenase subunit beta, partial [Sphingomonadales bacterium]
LHTLSNIRLVEKSAEKARATSCFVTYRHQRGNQDVYVGRHEYEFVSDQGKLKIRKKVSRLHMEALRPHGRITIIL